MSKAGLVPSKATVSSINSGVSIEVVLIDDCLAHIFSFLNARELVGVERVCKRWREVALSCMSRRQCLDFGSFLGILMMKQFAYPIEKRHVCRILSKFGSTGNLSALNIALPCTQKSLTGAEALRLTGTIFPNLEHLILGPGFNSLKKIPAELMKVVPNFKSLEIGDDLGASSYLPTLLKAAKNLESFFISRRFAFNEPLNWLDLTENCKHIELISYMDSYEWQIHLARLLTKLKKLEVLKVNVINGAIMERISTTCKYLDLTSLAENSRGENIGRSLQHLKNLESLFLGSTSFEIHPSALKSCAGTLKELVLPPYILSPGEKVWPYFPNLTGLHANEFAVSVNMDEMLTALVYQCPNLEELDIGGSNCSFRGLWELYNLPKLKRLGVNLCSQMDDACLKFVSYSLNRNLEKFECFNSANFSDGELLRLIKRCRKLRELEVDLSVRSEFMKQALDLVGGITDATSTGYKTVDSRKLPPASERDRLLRKIIAKYNKR